MWPHFFLIENIILISFLFWFSGPQMPKRIRSLSAAVLGGDLYTIGGYSPDSIGLRKFPGSGETEIQKLSCSSRVCTWTTINQQLKVGRWITVAIPVMDSLCTPTTSTTTTTTAITTTSTTITTTVTTTTTTTTKTTSTTSTTTTTANVISSKSKYKYDGL